VKIAVRAWGLDPSILHHIFSPHSRLQNTTDPIPLGRGCCGSIIAVGFDVKGLEEGMQVLALAPGEVRSELTVPASLVVPAAQPLVPEEAAFLWPHVTACYALSRLARLAPHDRLLIHGASQDVGQAAIQWAKRVGATVYVTDETSEKRELLSAQGISSVSQWEHERYVDDIIRWTHGKGVDVVLNCLPYRLGSKGLSVVRSHGRIIQLTENEKQSQERFAIAPSPPNLSFSFLDIMGLIKDSPEYLKEALNEVITERGVLAPPATHLISVREFPDALALSEEGGLSDRTPVLVLDDPQLPIAMPLSDDDSLKANGTYLITGGLGGLGIELATQMITKGARHLALLSRSGCKTDDQAAAVTRLTEAGARVLVLKADVSDPEMVKDALVRIRAEMPPLHGIVHAAGLLDDALLPRQNLERLHTVAAPKISGAWNLHVLTQKDPLDFFILYSSVATIFGLPGLGNYAAANAFLDALAHLRHTQGLPALSINWGSFSNVGLAAASSIRGERLVHQGFDTINPEEGTKILLELLARERSAQVCVTPFDVQKWVQSHPHAADSSLLAQLIEDKGGEMTAASTSFTDIMRTALPQERQGLMETFVSNEVAKVLRMQPPQIGPNIRFKNLGIDSLMGLEIRNRIETTLDLQLPATLLWTHPDIADLARYLNGKLQPQSNSAPGIEPASGGKHVHRRLFCFPYGGGDASIFNHWTTRLSPGFEVYPIQLPGRHSASVLGNPKNFSELVRAVQLSISPLLDDPYAFYGHSMGALLAFEVARSLRRSNIAAPLHLFLSAYPPPNAHLIQSLLPIKENMTDEDLLNVSTLLIPTIGKLENKEYVSPILPLLRSDFSLVNSYHYLAESPLSCPITAFGGIEDEVVKKEHLLDWQNQTLGTFSLKMIPGDHLFLHRSWETIVSAIEEDLITD
jgi:polyketide synthase 12/epothilone polyketide synthase D